ncbi:MAG: hypothetical protein J0I20_28195 [Chloroflexi bacterium]|nr:hypothetical protein [Chloroflexota bacterium]OJV97568.1 MAG: hypothetical protein BGO39_07325 [Chloroflexi bacterium 54-19]
MAKEIVISTDADPKSSKYFVWQMDEQEAEQVKEAIGDMDLNFPLLSTLSDYHEDFLCEGERLLGLMQETVELEMNLEEHHRETKTLVKLLTMIGGLAALSHDHKLGVYAYGD